MPSSWVQAAALKISLDGAGNPEVADLALGYGLTRNDRSGVVDPLLCGVGRQGGGRWRSVAGAGYEAGRKAGVQGDHSVISQTRAPVIVRITLVILLRFIQGLSQWGLK